MINKLKNEAGYSLVEVTASIVILSIAIIPMVGMFDAGLRAATTGSKYDTARALANANLEKVKALPYARALVDYKPVNASPAGTEVSCNTGAYACEVRTSYVNDSFSPDSNYKTQMEIEVTVKWDGNKSYVATGFKSSGGSA